MTPWDAGAVPVALAQWLQRKPPGLRVLVPGCGTGYEIRLFDERGDDVLAVDFSDSAVAAARHELGPLASRVRKADVFAIEERDYALVYERAFLCALPRRLWPSWASRMAELIRPGGELAGFFYFNDNAKGPPFGIAMQALAALLGDRFTLVEDLPIPEAQSLPVFKGKERWQVWERKL